MIASKRLFYLSVALMRRMVAFLILTVCFVFSIHGNAQTNWPMPGHDAQHTGRANFAGPTSAPAAPAWTFSTASSIVDDIVTSVEGTLYFASDQLYALKPDGTAFAPSVSIGVPATGPVVDDSLGLIYIAVAAADGGFDVLRLTKQLQGLAVILHVPRPPNGAIISPLVLGRGGLVFFVAGRFPGVVYAAGPVQWSNPVCPAEAGPNTPFGASANSPVVSTDGSFLFVMCGGGTGGQDGLLRLQAGTGVVAASTPTNRNSTEAALDSLQHLRSGWQAFGGAVFCGDYLTWDFSLSLLTTPAAACDSSRFTTSRAAIMPDGQSTVRIGFAFPPNNQLDAEGINNWIISTDGATVPNFTSLPSVDAAGNVFIGNTQGIEALSPIDGHALWSFTTGDQITTQPVIANGGALYVGSSSGKVYAFNTTPAHQSGTVYVSGSGAGFATVNLLSASVTATNNTFTDGGVIAVSPDGTRSYVSAIFGLAVVDNTTNQVITTISVGSRPAWVALSPDGSRVYVSQPNIGSAPGVLQGVYVIDTVTNAIIASIPIPGPQRVAVAPDNSRVYVGSGGRGIIVLDPITNTVVRSVDILGAQTTGIAFTPDGAHAYVGEINGPSVYLIDARADALLQTIPLSGSLGGGVSGIIASPDGSKVYAGNVRNGPFVTAPRDVFVIDTTTNAVTGQISVSFPSPQFAISSDGGYLLVGDSDIGNLIVASLATNSVVESIHVNDPCCPNITGVDAAPTATIVRPPAPLPVIPPNLGPPGPTNPQGFSAEPVSTGSGNYFYHHTDFAIPGRGIGLRFERTYNSVDSYSGPLGANWTHNYNVTLAHNPTTAQIKWGDGHGETFTLVNGVYVPQHGVFSSLVQQPDTTFILLTKKQIQYQFTSNGKLMRISDSNGNSCILSYDSAGNLVSVSDATGRKLSFAYDSSNRIAQVLDPLSRTVTFSYSSSGDLIQAQDPASGIYAFSYDTQHRLISFTSPGGNLVLQNTLDSRGRVIGQVNARGATTTFSYDTPVAGTTTIVDALGNTTLHSYDQQLRLIKITDALGSSTSFAYDVDNNRTKIVDRKGGQTLLTYDALGNLLQLTEALGHVARFTYDSTNNLATITDPKGAISTFQYDAQNNLLISTDALLNVTSFTYDQFGQLTSRTNPRGKTTGFSYDSFGNPATIIDPLGHKKTLAFDAGGRLLSTTDAKGHTVHVVYDALNRPLSIADALGEATQFAYDQLGNLLRVTDANGNITKFAYDSVQNLTAATDALGNVTHYTYDFNNNRISVLNPRGFTTSYGYDALNRRVRKTDPLGFVASYSYDSAGKLASFVDPNGHKTAFTYDIVNRLLQVKYADTTSVAYSYDENGNRLAMTDAHGTTKYVYDALNRLISVTAPDGTQVSYAFDAVGNRARIGYPDGKSVAYSYDDANRLSSVIDWLGLKTTYTYDIDNTLTGEAYPNGTSRSLAYDSNHRITDITHSFSGNAGVGLGNQPLLETIQYTLDAVGNRLSATDENNRSNQYTYDALNRLIQVLSKSSLADPGKQTAYAYDSMSDRVSLTAQDGVLKYSYDADDRLLTAAAAAYVYDANGNQVTVIKCPTCAPIFYSYDLANRLTAVNGSGINHSFSYDGDGKRIAESIAAKASSFTNDVASFFPSVLESITPDGLFASVYGLQRIEQTGGKTNFFDHHDALGSDVALSDSGGHLLGEYSYGPWGEPAQVAGKVGDQNVFRFTGEAFSPDLGLYYLRARYYDPAIGRFISQDPLAELTSLPLARNAYEYANSNPIRFVDQSGLSASDTGAQGADSGTVRSFFNIDPTDLAQFFADRALDLAAGLARSDVQFSANANVFGEFLPSNPTLESIERLQLVGTLLDLGVSANTDMNDPSVRPALLIGRSSARLFLDVTPLGAALDSVDLVSPGFKNRFIDNSLTTAGDVGGNAILGTVNFLGLSSAFQNWASKPSILDFF